MIIDPRCFEQNVKNIVSISGGKDSLAQWLLAIEAGVNFMPVFADTGHEHPQTMEYLDYLESKLGPVTRVRADFTRKIEKKRNFIANNWYQGLIPDLMADRFEGCWALAPGYRIQEIPQHDGDEINVDEYLLYPNGRRERLIWPEAEPDDRYQVVTVNGFQWKPAIKGLNQQEAEIEAKSRVESALNSLRPTGIPFLDLCMWKGRFPSTKARFCTFELKHEPIKVQVVDPLIMAGTKVISWQGVRAQESPQRALLEPWEEGFDIGPRLAIYRPILKWTHDDVFALARRHGIKPNPLYQQGCSRVGCMPCIHARKSELAEIFSRWPEEIARVAEWEKLVARCSRRGNSTFFPSTQDPRKAEKRIDFVSLDSHGIETYRDWALTTRGGTQFDLLANVDDHSVCNSVYAGICE
ncbi:phosphoadenosine phosphosulfate reductase family protein [Pantoea sp. 9140]|uniref:phosphoadenosine phosphosulfate reductase domain-containing protein n=1 Tax=Pantoea sp. 9140 TaxID=1500896 RepID=UPI0007CC55AF|nr:phosphoadenosine phosphosulfate reductase family protein [Pantoea sp. 9140]